LGLAVSEKQIPQIVETVANSKRRIEWLEWLSVLAKQVLSMRACANHQEFIELA
jgi:hypothetical protein